MDGLVYRIFCIGVAKAEDVVESWIDRRDLQYQVRNGIVHRKKKNKGSKGEISKCYIALMNKL